jgi:hypothetical protein
MQYAIAAQEAFGGPASVAGQQAIGLGQVSLGQLALGERVLNVEAAAWPMRERQN